MGAAAEDGASSTPFLFQAVGAGGAFVAGGGETCNGILDDFRSVKNQHAKPKTARDEKHGEYDTQSSRVITDLSTT